MRFDASFKVAGKLNRAKWGEEKQVGGVVAPVINFVMGDGGGVERVEVVEQRVIEGGDIDAEDGAV